ncbi:hypothetical protein HN371_16050 [Candidatus Poribacteria bacterium]|jgi:hypothetical protein|nr:hypothetical protein [Candidatus Poribacteria bacterium]MBT5714999.1 hypothetical protein [Candidatus Poribacteria bacterium]MBT7101872.1 hypothetical protein [Candidatus Poribacteria bacterium]MBT7807253.1 hypothetical protein [Candidatus Poribacteria bacterium]
MRRAQGLGSRASLIAGLCCLVAAGCGDATPTTSYARQGSVVVGVFECADAATAKALLREWLAAPAPRAAPQPSAIASDDVAALLPNDAAIGRWVAVAPPQVVAGDALPLFLEQEADQYAAFGVQRVGWAEYANPMLGGRPMLRVDIYDMGSPENAFGLYSQRRVAEGKIRGIGAEASVGPRDVLAWVDRFVYSVTIFNYSTDTAEALIEFAERLGRSIDGVESPPSLVTDTPSRHLMPFSHRWFRTPEQRASATRRAAMSLFSLPEGSRGFVAKAVVGEAGHAEAFYVAFPTEQAAADAFAALRGSAPGDTEARDAGIGVESVRFRSAR